MKQQCRNQAAPCLERIHTRPPAFPKEGEIRCLLLTETSDLYYSKIVRLSFFFLFLLFTIRFSTFTNLRRSFLGGKKRALGFAHFLILSYRDSQCGEAFLGNGGSQTRESFLSKSKLARMFPINRAFTSAHRINRFFCSIKNVPHSRTSVNRL